MEMKKERLLVQFRMWRAEGKLGKRRRPRIYTTNVQNPYNMKLKIWVVLIICACLTSARGGGSAQEIGIRILSQDKSKSVVMMLDDSSIKRFIAMEKQIGEENDKQIKERQVEIIPHDIRVIWSREESIGFLFRKTDGKKEDVICFIGRSGQPLSALKKKMSSNDLTAKFQMFFVDLIRANLKYELSAPSQ